MSGFIIKQCMILPLRQLYSRLCFRVYFALLFRYFTVFLPRARGSLHFVLFAAGVTADNEELVSDTGSISWHGSAEDLTKLESAVAGHRRFLDVPGKRIRCLAAWTRRRRHAVSPRASCTAKRASSVEH